MCYAIPALVEKIDLDNAVVDYGGVIKKVNCSLIEDLKEGDYVLIHAGFAIEKLDKKSAEESIEIIKRDLAQFDVVDKESYEQELNERIDETKNEK